MTKNILFFCLPNFFKHSSVWGYVHGFYKLAIVISASVNIDVQVSLVCWSGVVYINTMEGSSCVVCLIYLWGTSIQTFSLTGERWNLIASEADYCFICLMVPCILYFETVYFISCFIDLVIWLHAVYFIEFFVYFGNSSSIRCIAGTDFVAFYFY